MVNKDAVIVSENNNEDEQMKLMGQILDIVYLQRMRTNSDRIEMMKCFTKVFGEDNIKKMSWDIYPDWMITDKHLQIGHCMLPNQLTAHEFDSFSSKNLSILFNHRSILQHTIRCVNENWPILLVGPNNCGKTSLIRLLSQLTNHRLHEFAMTPEIESSELLGCFEQVDVLRHIRAFIQRFNEFILKITRKHLTVHTNKNNVNIAHIQQLLKEWKVIFNVMYLEADDTKLSTDDIADLTKDSSKQTHVTLAATVLNDKRIFQIKNIFHMTQKQIIADNLEYTNTIQMMMTEFEDLIKICKSGTIGHFEWIDGTLIHALEKGEWILLENVNFCNPTVLDRLNPLLEPNGVLLVNECGLINGKARIITPHKDFRIFFTMNPKFGEISRAMRNRCVEIAILDIHHKSPTTNTLVSPKLNDLEQLLVLSGVEWKFLRNKMIDIHIQLLDYISQSPSRKEKDLSHHYILYALSYIHQHDMTYAKGYELTKLLLSWSSLLSQQLEQGTNLKHAVSVSFAQTYSNIFHLMQGSQDHLHKEQDSDISVSSLLEEFINDNLQDLAENKSISFDLYCSQLLNHMQRAALSKCIPIMDHSNNSNNDNVSRIWLDLFKINPESLEYRIMDSYHNSLTPGTYNSSCLIKCFPKIYQSVLFQNYIQSLQQFSNEIGINAYIFLQHGLFYQNNSPFNEFIEHQLEHVHGKSMIATQRNRLHLQQQLLQIHNQHCLQCMNEDDQIIAIRQIKNQNLNKMTVLQLSYALQYNKKLVSKGKLERQYQFNVNLVSCMEQIVPLFKCVDQWFTSLLCIICDQKDDLESILDIHEAINSILSIRKQSFYSLKYMPSEFKLHYQQIRFRELLKRIERMYNTYPITYKSQDEHAKHQHSVITALINITSKTSSSLAKTNSLQITVSQKHQRAKNRLYRYGGQGFISRNIKIGEILQELNSLNEQISFESQVHWNVYDINSNHSASNRNMLRALLNSDGDKLCYLVNYEWKYNLVNAWSTVHFLQTNFPSLFSQLSHEVENDQKKSVAIIPPKRSKSEQMAMDMFNTIKKAGKHLDVELVRFSQEFQQQLAKIQHKVKIDLTSDELSKIYFDPLEDEYNNNNNDGDENEVKMERELHAKQFLMSIDFSAKKHHIWLHLAPILTGIYLQREYNDILQKMPQFLIQSLIHNIFNKNTKHHMNDFKDLSSKLSSCIHHGLSIRSLSPSHFVPLQSMVWTINVLKAQCLEFEARQSQSLLPIPDINKSDDKLVFSTAQGLMHDEKKLWYQSLHKLYPGMDVAQFVNSGINSIMIMNILRNMTDHDVSIHSCNSMIAFLQHLTNHLATNSLIHKSANQDDIISYQHQKIWNNGAYLVALFCLTLSSFHRAFNDTDYQLIVQNCFKMWQNWHGKQKQHKVLTCSEFDKIMKRSSDIRLKQMVDEQIVTNLYNLCIDLFDTLCRKDENESYLNLQIKESNIWLLLGLIRLHLLFPARFFDPNLKFQIRLNDVESLLTQLFEEIELRKRIELFHSGKSTNYTIHNLQQKYKLLLKDRSSLMSKVTFRPESDLTFADFWHELTNFINNQFEYNQLIQLFSNFTSNDYGDGNYTYQHIQSTLQTSLNFIQRLNDKFSHFNDFVAPIIDAIELVRYGLSYCIISSNASSSIITNGIKQLLSPISSSIRHSLNLLNADLHQIIQKNCDFINGNNDNVKKSTLHQLDGKKLSSKLLLSGLKKSINFISNTGHSIQHITYDEVEVFDHWFSLFAHLYHEQEEQRRIEQQQKESFYKFDSKEMEAESKTNFWELFPDYLMDFRHLTASKTLHHKTQMKQDFAKLESKLVQDPTIIEKHQQVMDKQHNQQQLDDVLIDQNTVKTSSPQFAFNIQRKIDHKFVASLSIQDIKEIFKQHLYVFSNKVKSTKPTVSGTIIKEISESLSSQHRIAGILTELLSVKHTNNESKHPNHYNHGITVDNTVDNIGHISYLLSSTDLFSRFTSMSKASSSSSIINSKTLKFNNPIDVYTQSVPSYIRIVEKPLQALSVRIAGLLTAYPSHSVLLQLSELCSHLSSLSIRSPIMKVLTGLELLLSKAKSDWEDTCAARHTSIQTQLNPIFKLIGFWRKLELQSWSAIFQRKEQEICDTAINNWFYLYSLIHTEEISDDFIQSILENRKAKEKKTLHHEESFIKYASSLTPEQIFGVKAEEILERIQQSRNNPNDVFSKDEKSKIFLQEMFNHLNEFLENSPIGEIDIRLVMIQSFYQQMNCELYTKYDKHRINDKWIRIQLLRMIGNLIDYHSQFDNIINEHKKSTFQPIKAKLKELVKFTKWDLRNYWKLRVSAQKSHRKLAKLCYDWKIALKRSVSGILAESDIKETNEAAKNDPKIEFGKAEMYIKILKKNNFLRRILSKKKIKPDINDIDIEKPFEWLIENPSVINKQSMVHQPLDVPIDLSVGNITKLFEKMDKLQKRFYSHSHWRNRVFMQNDVESLCSSIIITTKEYANKDIPFPRKKRVLSILLQHFKQNGVKLFAPGDIDYLLPPQLFLNNNLSSKDALFVIRNHAFNKMVHYNNNEKYNEWFDTMTEKAQEYYQNVVRKMCQLRARRMSVHSDILQEANKCYGVTERLLSSITFQRNNLDELLKQITTLQQWYINIQYELNETKTDNRLIDIPSSDIIEQLFWKIREKLTIITQCVNTLTAVYSKVISICKEKNKKQNQSKKSIANQIFDSDDLAQFEESIPDFIADDDYEDGTDCNKINDPIIQSLIQSKTFITTEYDSSLTQIKHITSSLHKYQQIFDEIATHKLSPQQYESMHHECYTPFWSLNTFKQLSSIHNGLNTVYDSLQSLPCFNNLNITIQFEAVHNMDIDPCTNSWNEDYVKCYESIIEQIQFCIQDVIHLVDASEFNPPNPSTIHEDDTIRENVENKYFAFQQQSFIGISKAFHGQEIAEKLQKLIEIIYNNNMDTKILNDSLNNLLLMIRRIIDIGRFALNHNINCHKSFCKLEYVLTSLFNGLFVKGFCKKDEEKEEEGDGDQESNELGDGVGMADGKGIEDVSHEMENEAQVEGLNNDKQQTQQNKKEKHDDDDDIGVEMEQDFDGELEDVEDEPNKRDKADDSEDEIEDIDREIGDIDFNKSQVIDQRMWGSDDEEQENDDNDEINKQNEKDQNDETDRNNNQQLNTKDKYSQVQAKEDQNENDENEESKNNKSDPNQDNDEEDDKSQKEEQTARLEFGDELEDLDENVSDEEAKTEKKDKKNDDDENGDETFPRKEIEMDDNMDIDFSESDEGNIDDENNEDDAFDPKSLEQELKEKDLDREQEKMEDLQRGTGEIMPQNEAKDEELEFINDGDDDEEEEGNENDNELNGNNQEMMDIDKENEDENGNALQPEIDENGVEEEDEDIEDVNGPSNPDVLKPNMPDIDENKKENDENESDIEMERDENDKDEMKQNEDSEEEDANLKTENDGNENQNNDEAMGVYGGMGDTAPVGDDEDDDKDNDIEMQDEDDNDMEQQLSDIYGNDQQQMMQDTSKGEWQPINQENKKDQDPNKKRNEQKEKEIEDKTNPFRSLGDALSEWKQRLNMIEQDETAQREENIGDDNEEGNDDEEDNIDGDHYAHIPQDMNVENETQALMDNEDEEDITHLPNINDIHNDEEAFDDAENDNDPFDDEDELIHDKSSDDDDDKFNPYKKQKNTQNKNDMDSKQNDVKLKDLTIENNENEEETKQSYLDYIQQLFDDKDEEESKDHTDTPYLDMNINANDDDDEDEDNENEEMKTDENDEEEDGPTAVEIALLRNTLDERLSAWNESSSQNVLQSGDEIWRKLCLVTNSLSQQLSEELRTILEPLQMTKLGGDFRTGKRINMKKVIPYIASQFRKDKIWLRRCKPHKRNYQILVCIDDSESMRESSAGRLALESMCILTRALNKLEVGSIGVLSFGQTINLLHSLQRPFSDHCGSFVCSQFSFSQKETKYQDLIATIINVLSNNDATWKNIQQHIKQFNGGSKKNKFASFGGSHVSSVSWDGSETLSLVFIISDARIQQDRKQLEQLVRIAHERKQIVLLIIVDTNDETTSIVNVKSIHVDPLTSQVNISNYLDEFPFPYYVLLKDIQTLPNVVADSLRQWFELVRQSE